MAVQKYSILIPFHSTSSKAEGESTKKCTIDLTSFGFDKHGISANLSQRFESSQYLDKSDDSRTHVSSGNVSSIVKKDKPIKNLDKSLSEPDEFIKAMGIVFLSYFKTYIENSVDKKNSSIEITLNLHDLPAKVSNKKHQKIISDENIKNLMKGIENKISKIIKKRSKLELGKARITVSDAAKPSANPSANAGDTGNNAPSMATKIKNTIGSFFTLAGFSLVATGILFVAGLPELIGLAGIAMWGQVAACGLIATAGVFTIGYGISKVKSWFGGSKAPSPENKLADVEFSIAADVLEGKQNSFSPLHASQVSQSSLKSLRQDIQQNDIQEDFGQTKRLGI